MSVINSSQPATIHPGATNPTLPLLEQAIHATKQTSRDQLESLLGAFVQQAMTNTMVWDRNLNTTLQNTIRALDAKLSHQLAEFMHAPAFKQLEGAWRGLSYLVQNTETSPNLKIKVMSLSQRELFRDLDKAIEFDQSQLFKKIYEHEFGMPGGEPYGLLIGDYHFSNHPEEIETLSKVSHLAAAAFCPFISAASAQFFGFDDWRELSRPRDLAKIFEGVEHSKWRSFRASEEARFVTLTLPRVLARLPYGADGRRIDAFQYEEISIRRGGRAAQQEHENYCWMNSAYTLGSQITQSYAKYGWGTAIRGTENGGKVENLPLQTFYTADGDLSHQCPSEIGITDRREAELSKLGFLPLCHYKNTDYAVYFGAQTTQIPTKFDQPEATANAAISARLPYILASSRFAHYLKILARDKIGSFMEVSDCEKWLDQWINQYVNANRAIGSELRSKCPLQAASVNVVEVPGNPGAYHAVAWLRPWLQMEELTASIRLVAKIPKALKS